MKAKIKIWVILCLILTVVTALVQIPTEAKAYTLCETCFAEKQAGGAYGYQYFYIVDLSGAVTEYVYNNKGLLVEETNPLGEITVYTYDAFGIRSSLKENGVTTQYMTYNGIVLAAYNTNGERTEHYTYGNKILAWE